MTDGEQLRLAEEVRTACLEAALDAFQRGGFSGLCLEGRWELAIDAIRALRMTELVQRAEDVSTDEPAS